MYNMKLIAKIYVCITKYCENSVYKANLNKLLGVSDFPNSLQLLLFYNQKCDFQKLN